MMNERFVLVSSDVMNRCVNAVIDAFNAGGECVVTIKDGKRSRSDAQHRLRWLWFSQLERQLAGVGKGRTKEQWNMFFKHRFVPDLLIEQDEDYNDVFRQYRDTCRMLSERPELLHKYQTDFWDRVISTRDMSVKTMSAWLNMIDRYVLDEYSVVLITPDDLKWAK